MPESGLMSIAEFAALPGVKYGHNHIRQLVKQGAIPAKKSGCRNYIIVEMAIEWLKQPDNVRTIYCGRGKGLKK